MIGTTVQRGYDTWQGSVGSSGSLINTTALNLTVPTSTFNGTTNGTDGSIPMIGKEEESMSAEELSVRLSYAMSLTFMVGIIQVSNY